MKIDRLNIENIPSLTDGETIIACVESKIYMTH